MTGKSVDNASRVFVIGLDGASYDLIGPWIKENKLPNLARFMEGGSWGQLASTIPAISPVAWTTSVTGVNPGKHGIFDFLCRQPDTYKMKVMNASMRRTKPVWTLLSEAGKKVAVMNVPMTYPPDEVNGVMISGLGTPSLNCPFTHPGTLKDDIMKKFGKYYLNLRDVPEPRQRMANEVKMIQRLCDLIEHRFEVAAYLLELGRWDFFMVVFMETDTAQHTFWCLIDPTHPLYDEKKAHEYGDAIFKIYKKIDEKIGHWLEAFGEDTTFIVMSDHGAGPFYKPFFIQNWMVKNGYLNVSKTLANSLSAQGLRQFLSRSVSATKKLLPNKLKERLRRSMPGLREKIITSELVSNINWEKTLAFSEGAAPGIFINVKEKAPKGTVSPGKSYEDLLDKLTSDLLAIKDPETGKKIVEAVHRTNDIYRGDCLGYAPDLCVCWNNGYHGITGWLTMLHKFGSDGKNTCFGTLKKNQWTGAHRSNGIIQLKGPHICRGTKLQGSQIADVTPTVLYLLGFEIPQEIDGKVLEVAFEDSFIKSHPIRHSSSTSLKVSDMEKRFSEDDAEKVQEELRSLGYIE